MTQLANVKVLLAVPGKEEAQQLGDALAAAGAAVTRTMRAADAAEELQHSGFDVAILSHPLPDADVIGSSAALGQVPGAPPIILLDVIDQTEAIERTLPAPMRPRGMMVKPVDPEKLAALVREVIELPDDGGTLLEPGFERLALRMMEIKRRGLTGTMEVSADGVITRIHFLEGRPASAEGGSLRETLGRMLLRTGTLTEEEYVRVIDRMTEQVINHEQQRMGEVLVELGLLSEEDITAALCRQVAEKVTACFQWSSAHLTFEETDGLPEGFEPFEVSPVESLILDGIRLHVEAQEIDTRLRGHAKRKIRLNRDAMSLAADFGLDDSERRALNALVGKGTLGAALADGRQTHLVAALLWTGAATFEEEEGKPARPARRAPQRREKPQFAREVVMPRARKEKPADAAKPEKKSITRPNSTVPIDEGQAKLEAEGLFRRAQSQLANDKFSDAVTTLASVIELQPLEPEYRMFEAWATYLQARVDVRIARAKAVACARRVAEADPKAAKPHALLGRLALDDGDDDLATREFQAALVRDPEDADAHRGIKQTRPQK